MQDAPGHENPIFRLECNVDSGRQRAMTFSLVTNSHRQGPLHLCLQACQHKLPRAHLIPQDTIVLHDRDDVVACFFVLETL